jgi:hypothetical protein
MKTIKNSNLSVNKSSNNTKVIFSSFIKSSQLKSASSLSSKDSLNKIDFKIYPVLKKSLFNCHKIFVDFKEDLKAISKNEDFTSFALQKSLDVILQAIEDKKNKVELFNIVNLSLIVEIDSTQYPAILKKIQEHYSQLEDFDKCIEIQDVINKLSMYEKV